MTPREAAARAEYREKVWEWFAIVLGSLLLWLGTSDVLGKDRDTVWTRFVQVEGQPEAVPEQWVSTPEGRFAHSIRIPNPVPKDSGYRRGMSSEEYFQHLCRTEAGEFIFKTVENVEGFFLMRPPKRPTDDDLKDRYKLEAPEIERTFQLVAPTTFERALIFIAPPFNTFRFVEEVSPQTGPEKAFVRAYGYEGGRTPMTIEPVRKLISTYAVVWRGVRRPNDRELAIAGSEWLVVDFREDMVLGVLRNYGITGRTRNAPNGIWWLNALSCPQFASRYRFATSEKLYDFVSKVIRPVPATEKGISNAK